MRTVVLLGAGASFGSLDVEPHTPPLGDALFEELERQGGVAAELPLGLKKVFRDQHFESGMAAYYEHSKGNVMRFQRELAHYLARFRPGRNNVYIRLIRELGIHRIIYSSLNYDLLFENAASMLGLSCSYGTNRPDGYVRLLKLHGSCNFWPDFRGISMRGCTFEEINNADIQWPIRPLSSKETIQRCIEDSMAPAIAIYAEGKAVRISPDFVANQQAMWISSANHARRVFIAGVRVHQADQHIWGTLGHCKADVTYFGLPSDKDGFLAWAEESRKRNAHFFKANFSECVSHIKRLK